MPTIFQLTHQELRSLLKFLRPQLDPAQIDHATETKLRLQITEWLLLNGLSTMHHFDRTESEWILPNKADCISCGEYRIGQRRKIYHMYAPTTEVITTEPEKIQHMHYSTSMPSSSTPPIQTKHGNLDQVAYIQSHEQSSRPREKIQEDNGCCASSACCGSANAGDNSCLDLCLVCLFFECLRT